MSRIDKYITSHARKKAYCIIREAKESKKPLQAFVSYALREENEQGNEHTALITEIVYGYFRYSIRLHSLLSLTIKKIKKIPEDMLDLLACALYEILYLESTKDASTIFNTVEIIKKAYGIELASLSNAVLRKVVRNKEEYLSIQCYNTELSDEIYAKHYSLPLWIWKKLQNQLGEKSEEYASFFLKRPEVNPEYNKSAFTLLKALGADNWEGSIWDCCSGRGGKSVLLQKFNKNVAILSDTYIKRLYHATSFYGKRVCTDARHPPFKENTFDIVLADVPCSGLGTIMKRPDTKIKRMEKDIASLCEIQKNILEGISPIIKKGGLLVYITCTWSREENEDQIRRFVQKHKEYIIQCEHNSSLEYNDVLYGAVLFKS